MYLTTILKERPLFGQAKNRNDIPDAFILCAGRQFAFSTAGHRIAICNDKRMRNALTGLPGVDTFSGIKEFLQSELGRQSLNRLELHKVWTDEKREEAIALLKQKKGFIKRKVEHFADNVLPGNTFSHGSLPTDNEEGTIDGTYDVEKLELDWGAMDVIGPGWIALPFSFETDADLTLWIYRMDSFSVPSWIQVHIGDFEEEHYFEASAHRRMRVSAVLLFKFDKKELTATPVKLPSNVEIDDVEIDLIDEVSDWPDDYEPGMME